jgi:hypothetical protein
VDPSIGCPGPSPTLGVVVVNAKVAELVQLALVTVYVRIAVPAVSAVTVHVVVANAVTCRELGLLLVHTPPPVPLAVTVLVGAVTVLMVVPPTVESVPGIAAALTVNCTIRLQPFVHV